MAPPTPQPGAQPGEATPEAGPEVTPGTGPDGGRGRRRLVAEIWLVLGVSLGQSAVYSVISLGAKLTAGRPLAQQTATLNASVSPRPYLDLTYQLAGIAFTIVPAALALWLLSADGRSAVRQLGLDHRRPLPDLGAGAVLGLLIGLPGLGLYLVGHALGITATVVPAALNPHWWTIPVLVLQAVKNAVIEEVVVVGYLITRLRELRWPTWAVLGCSAALRGSYHLYQGFGPFLGNAVMGLVFGEWFRRRGRVMPLVIAHTLLDVASFVGYDLLASTLHLP
jgi:membrane protease YdiL (CAAX protease family)